MDTSEGHHIRKEVRAVADEDGDGRSGPPDQPPQERCEEGGDEDEGYEGVEEGAVPEEAVEFFGDTS